MAKKKTNKGKVDDVELDDMDGLDDLDGMDFGDMEDIGDDRNPSKTGVAKDLAEEAGKGFLGELMKSTAKKSLPESYENNYDEAMDYVDFGKEMVGQSKSRIQKSIYGLGKEVKKILPFQSKMLENFLQKYEDDNVKSREQSEEAMRESAIGGSLAGIFDKQLEVQKALQVRSDARGEVENKQRMVSTKLQTNILTSIDSNIAQQTAFTLQVGKEYYRKSLELQYKSYYIQADLLKSTKDYFKGFSLQFEGIVKNTGLPDYVKLSNTERLGEKMRNKAMEGIEQTLFSNNKYVSKIKERVGGLVKNKVGDFTEKIDGFTDGLSSLSSVAESPAQMAAMIGSVLAGTAGGTYGEKLAGKISPKIKEKLANNNAINAGASGLNMMAKSPRYLMAMLDNKNKMMKEHYEAEGTPGQMAGSMLHKTLGGLLEVTKADSFGGEVKDTNVLSHNKPAIFDNKVHRSITEVIPMYLSKILIENTDLKRMYNTVNKKFLNGFTATESQVYDYEARKLSTVGEYRTNIETKVLASSSKKSKMGNLSSSLMSEAKANLLATKGDKKDISLLGDKKSNTLVQEYLNQVSEYADVDQDFNTLFVEASKGNGDGRILKLIETNPELKKVIETLSKSTTDKGKEGFSDRLKDTVNQYPTEPVISLFREAALILDANGIKNTLTPEQAMVVSKAFSTFSHNQPKHGGGGTGQPVMPEDVMSGKFASSFTKDGMSKVQKKYEIFVNDVGNILRTGTSAQKMGLHELFGNVANAIDNNVNVGLEIAQSLRDLSPDLIDTGDISNKFFTEGKLDRGPEEEMVSAEEAKAIGKTGKLTLDENRTDVIRSIMNSEVFKSTKDLKKRFDKDISEAGKNPFKLANVLIKYGKETIEKTRKKLKKGYDKAAGHAKDLEKMASEFVGAKSGEAVAAFGQKLKEYGKEVDKLIMAERVALDEAIKVINELKEKASENINVDHTKFDREIKKVTDMTNAKIKVLEELSKTLVKTSDELNATIEDIKNKAGESGQELSETLKGLRAIMAKHVETFKGLLKKAEDIETAAAAA